VQDGFHSAFNPFHRCYLRWVSVLRIESSAEELLYEKVVGAIVERDGHVDIGCGAVDRSGKLEIEADRILDAEELDLVL
jgi:hypothetical protein